MRARIAVIAVLAALGVVLAMRAHRGPGTPRATPVAPGPAAEEARDASASEPRVAAAFVSGTVSGRYGPLFGVPIVARCDGEVVGEAVTDPLGRYRLEVAPGVGLTIDALPVPGTELAPARQTVLPVAGEEVTADFELARGGTASGEIAGDVLDIVAIRADDYPLGPDPLPIGALEAAPKVGAEENPFIPFSPFSGPSKRPFVFRGLDPTALYRLAVLDRDWAVDGAVLFRAGETGICAGVVRVLRVFVEAIDIESREPIARFRVSLVDTDERVLETLEGQDGRLSRCLVGNRGNPEVLVVAADGYLDEECPAHGVRRVALSRAREPNVLLRIAYDDGTPYDGEIETDFESTDDPDGLVATAVRKAGPGRFRTTVPAGAWRLHVIRPRAFHGVTQIADLDVPAEGTAEAALRLARGGLVTFEGDMTIEREVEGEWQQVVVRKGTWEDVPCGVYRVMDGDKERERLEVRAGSSLSVRGPPKPDRFEEARRALRDLQDLERRLREQQDDEED